MFCFADRTGEALAGILRAGNAGANTASDHLSVLDTAVSQLGDQIAAGHRPGEAPDVVNRQIVVRADSAGCTRDFLGGCVDRNISFMVSARKKPQITEAESVGGVGVDLGGSRCGSASVQPARG